MLEGADVEGNHIEMLYSPQILRTVPLGRQ